PSVSPAVSGCLWLSLAVSGCLWLTPVGCGADVLSLYYALCDLGAAWGVVLEAVAAAGAVASAVLFISLLASLPFVTDGARRSSVALHAFFLVGAAGLFLLAFAFIVGKDFSTCASRRFLFGVLFAGCFSCLLMQAVRLNVLSRRGAAPRAWPLCLGALALWLVEVVINAEWLIVTVVRHPLRPLNATGGAAATPCNIANQDFAMALIYVVALMAAALAAGLAVMAGGSSRWRKDGGLIFLTGLLSAAIWVAWIVMYVFGNERTGGPAWDDPTLAIALVSNAWTFVLLHTVPEICRLTGDAENRQDPGQDLYPGRAVGYETILKEQSAQNVFVENKAFSMDEDPQGANPVSPYSGYTGQPRSSVYQPTELALISKAPPQDSYDIIIPRASAGSAHRGRSSPSTHAESAAHTQPSVGPP
uniref:G protein-coupled receptor, class C, group 5, member C n=1 Tax=Salarias fasciatus TaxID=181472 RepID=A0A672IGW5_SALFA